MLNFIRRLLDPEYIDNDTCKLITAQLNSFNLNYHKYGWTPDDLKLFMPDVHIKLKFGNDPDKTDLWKAIIYEVDTDFPWSPMNAINTTGKFCQKCNGWLWPNTFLLPQDLKKAARQAGMALKGPEDVRVQNFVAATKCGGTLENKVLEY